MKSKIILTTSLMSISTYLFSEASVVNFYNWADYVDPAVIEQFEKETGITVNYDVFDTNEVLEAKMLTGGSGYDVVVPTGAFLERQINAGVYQKIDKNLLSNLSNIELDISKKTENHDPGSIYSVPYTWGTIGIGYNSEMVAERLGDLPVDSWDIFFKPELLSQLEDCGVNVVESPAEIISIALNYLGRDPNSENKQDLADAAELVSKARTYISKFTSSEYRSNLASGDVCLAVGYNGDILMAQIDAIAADDGVEVLYSIPKEGTMIWFDLMAIPKDAPHPRAAHKFINYLLSPEGAAGISNYAYFAVPNNKVGPFLLDEIKMDPSIYPPKHIREKLFPQKAHSARFDRLLTRTWTDIKMGQ